MGENKISIYRYMSAGCNGCDIEIIESLVPRYKLEDLGIQVVYTPEEANTLAITGGINIKGKEELLKAYEKLQQPKIVIAVGNCALTKEIFDKGYPMVGPPDQIIPINIYISGCPPRPQAIVTSIAKNLGLTLEENEEYWNTPEDFRGKHEFNKEKCMGCGACAQICSSDAIELIENSSERIVKINYGHCSFCAFCEDECPTQAIKLTQEYNLMADDRSKLNIANEVKMQQCVLCNTYFVPELQIEWALRKIEENTPEYKNLENVLRDAIKTCVSCRNKIHKIKEAKKSLTELSVQARKV